MAAAASKQSRVRRLPVPDYHNPNAGRFRRDQRQFCHPETDGWLHQPHRLGFSLDASGSLPNRRSLHPSPPGLCYDPVHNCTRSSTGRKRPANARRTRTWPQIISDLASPHWRDQQSQRKRIDADRRPSATPARFFCHGAHSEVDWGRLAACLITHPHKCRYALGNRVAANRAGPGKPPEGTATTWRREIALIVRCPNA